MITHIYAFILTWHLPVSPRADEVNALVIDLGSCTVKAGYAGEDTPKALFPSVSPFDTQPGAGSGLDWLRRGQ